MLFCFNEISARGGGGERDTANSENSFFFLSLPTPTLFPFSLINQDWYAQSATMKAAFMFNAQFDIETVLLWSIITLISSNLDLKDLTFLLPSPFAQRSAQCYIFFPIWQERFWLHHLIVCFSYVIHGQRDSPVLVSLLKFHIFFLYFCIFVQMWWWPLYSVCFSVFGIGRKRLQDV